MTSVCLKSKSSLSTEMWSGIFTGLNTEAKSCLFIKQLTSTCFSTILHLRKVFPDDYFEEKGFEGMTLKLLKSRKGNNYVSKIEQWLEGAFEALEKKYLKRLMLDIQDAESNLTLEIYTMTFNYTKENEVLNPLFSTNASYKTSGITICDTKLNTIKLLQMCHAVTETYSNLPSQVKLSMRLSYYENTPEDYHPMGYVAWESMDTQFSKQARSIEIGITSTHHHFFKLFNKSCLSDKFFQDLEKQLGSSSTLPLTDKGDQLERQTKAKRELCFENPNKCSQTSLMPTSERQAEFMVTEKHKSVSNNGIVEYKVPKNKIRDKLGATTKQMALPYLRSQKVRCACLSSNITNTMFPCLGCKFLVHAECYGILQFDPTKKVRFYCHLCHQIENNLKCHDKVIMSLKSSADQQKLSVLRRILHYCNMPGVDKITVIKMEKILGNTCSKNVVNVVLNKMIEIGVAVVQGKKRTYLINKQTLENQLVHYFYKMQNCSHSQLQGRPFSLRTSDRLKRKNAEEILFKGSKHSNVVTQDFLTCNSQTSQQSCDIFC